MADNVATARRILDEAFGAGNLDVIDEVTTEGFVNHDPVMGDQDREASKQSVTAYRAAFPDLEFTIDEIFEVDDKVVTRWSASGTFEGEFMGQQPTGERGEPVRGIGIDRFEDGRIAESWAQWDMLTFMRNIGMAPDPAAASAS